MKADLIAQEYKKYGARQDHNHDIFPYYWEKSNWDLFVTTDNPDVERLLIEKAASSRSTHCASIY